MGVDANASKEHLDGVARRVGIDQPEDLNKDDEVQAIEKASALATARPRTR
ncbi:hypothetical protein AB0I85_27350 [Micromonospora echinofusca]|uniref:hypothetical protein n=1 Tax=Micromonospora echinofusca TaxID=47858 RepID=UPI0033DE8EC2